MTTMKDKSQAHKWREGEGTFIRTHLAVKLPADLAAGEPFSVHALPWGNNALRDGEIRERFDEPGTLAVNERTAADVPANFAARDTDFYVNINHMRGRAYGWLEDVTVTETDGIVIDVNWTKEGAALVEDQAYRYSSIEVVLDASQWLVDGSPADVVAVTGLALENNPAVIGQAPIAYETLNAALSASDGREIGKRQNSPGDSGEKGVPTMSEGIFKGLFTGVFGREPKDDVDAAEMAAELKGYKEKYPGLTADLTKATSQVAELTEKLDKATTTISEFEAADKERREPDQGGCNRWQARPDSVRLGQGQLRGVSLARRGRQGWRRGSAQGPRGDRQSHR
jgi:phage I-like protein